MKVSLHSAVMVGWCFAVVSLPISAIAGPPFRTDEPGTEIEIICKRCGLGRYETQAKLITEPGFNNLYLDQVEYSLCCSNRFCRGCVRISLLHEDKNEGFVGGMA